MTAFQNLKKLFKLHADENTARQMAAYMRGQFKYYGIPTPQRRALSKPFLGKKSDAIDWGFVTACWGAEAREFQYIAMDYLYLRTAQLTKADVPEIRAFAEAKSWWDTIDGLDQLVGAIAQKDKSVKQLLLKWSKDKNFWIRRMAIDHQLNYRDKTDTTLLAAIIENNFGQTEFFINKAIGWALREYSKTDPRWVREFLARHAERLSPLSLREAGKYIG